MKKPWLLALALTLALSLSACGGDSETKEEGAEDTAAITFVLDYTPNTNRSGVYVALAEGYFEDAGLDVTVVQPPEDGAEALVGAGRGEFGVSYQDYLPPAWLGNSPLDITTVAAVLQHNSSGIMSRAGEGMDRPKGLEGKKYATWDLPVETAMVRHVVDQDGGNFDLVQRIPSTATDEYAALASRSIDAIWTFEGWGMLQAELQGMDTDYFAFKDIDPVLDYYTPVIIANDLFLDEHPEESRAFLEALEKGYRFAAEHPDEAATILLEAVPELDEDLVRASQALLSEQYFADSPTWGTIDGERWQAFYDWLYEESLIDEAIPVGFGWTNDYLPSQA